MKLLFVVQKHKATSLHYDFRLEINGKMPSWSIPKGPTLNATVKHLAIRTPDHDMEWRKFEGIIPEGQYGAGTVMIWDEGMYTPERELAKGVRKEIADRKEGEMLMEEGLKAGQLKFTLHGKKLKGSFALVKTRGFSSKQETWLLIKHHDGYEDTDYDINNYDFSAVSNKSLDEITKEGKITK